MQEHSLYGIFATAADMATTSPEFTAIRKKLPSILDAIAKIPATIPLLTASLLAEDLIHQQVKNDVDYTSGITPFEKANKIVDAVHLNVRFNTELFYKFIEVLRDCQFDQIAIILEEECCKYTYTYRAIYYLILYVYSTTRW